MTAREQVAFNSLTSTWELALKQFVDELRELYGARLRQVILFGSRARGEGDECSDIDILVLLNPLGDFWEELSRIGNVANRISLEYDVVVSAIPAEFEEFQHRDSPLFMNARREGVPVQ